MHSLPSDFNSSLLVGRTFESICFAKYQVNLHLSNGLTIQVESGYEFSDLKGVSESVSGFPLESSALLKILGDEISSVEFDRPSGDIAIYLKGGGLLSLKGDAGQYESYRMIFKDRDIVV